MSDQPIEIDPLDWAVQRLQWQDTPPGFSYDSCGIGETSPIWRISDRVVKRLIRHMIMNADFDGLGAAMEETELVMAEQLAVDRRRHEDRQTHAAIRQHQLASDCGFCGATSGQACRSRSGADLSTPHSQRGARS